MRIYNKTPFLREYFFYILQKLNIFGIKPGMSNIIFKKSHGILPAEASFVLL